MADITLTIPDDKLDRVKDAFAGHFGWADQIPDPENPGEMIPNPETKGQHLKRRVIDFTIRVVRSHEQSVAITTAQASVTDIDGIG